MPSPRRQPLFAGFEDEPTAPPPALSPPVPAAPAVIDASSVAGKTVYVVDSHSLIYQVFHAMPEMTGPNGQPVGAVQGFIRDMLDILEKKQPDFLFCAFDDHGDTFRHGLYEKYKANRSEMPADLRPQIPNVRRFLAALGIPALVCPEYEADDILALVARRTESLGGTCVIVTGDKDCRQLITDHVRVLNIRKDELFDAAALEQEWGVRPDQVVDFQALVGDSVDNVPGVPMVGPKFACELLKKYGTLDNLYEHLDELPANKRRENLQTHRDLALLSRQLVRLVDAPLEIDWQAGHVGGVNRQAALDLCREFGLRRLGERIGALHVADAPTTWIANYQTVTSLEQLRELAETMHRQPRISIDTETTSVSPRAADLVGVSFAWEVGEAYYVPIRAPHGEPQLAEADVLAILRPVLEDAAVGKIGQNIKYDRIVLRGTGVELRGLAFDTMVADYLLDPGERIHNLNDLAKRIFNHTTIKIDELIGAGKNQKRMDEVPVPLITQYAAEDADVPLRLARVLEPRLVDEQLDGLFRELEMPLVEVLAEMEFNGIRIDVDRLGEMSRRFADRLASLQVEIYSLAGGEFNIDSPKQLAKLLFEQLHLPVLKKTKTGPSTDADVLGDLAKLHPLPTKIIDHRQTSKLKSTYVDALPEMVCPRTGRIHSSFKQDVAATGRLSSTDPNLQNIPIRTEEGRAIRSAFLPGEAGWLLLAADYSQIELRVLAHCSGDETLRAAFHADRDIHAQVAAEVYGVPLDAVTREQRRAAKAVNFGVIYGQSPFGLAKALDIDKSEAAKFIETYFAKYSGVATFIRQTLIDCRRQGFVSTILGRRRPVHGVRDLAQVKDPNQRTLPERIAINTVIQGSAADIIKRAMIRVFRQMKEEQLRARLLLQIHDELVLEFPPDEQTRITALVVEEMAASANLAVPLKVDFKIGPNWAECE